MLQRVQTEISKIRGFGMAEHAEYTTLIVEMIVGESELGIHCFSARSSECAQTSRSASTDSSIIALPWYWMLKMPSLVTCPMTVGGDAAFFARNFQNRIQR